MSHHLINYDFPKPLQNNVWSLKIMARGDGYPEGQAATLNTAAVTPMRSRRRIEHLKQLAYDCNLTNEQAKHFGKLTATATWEKLLAAHGLEFEPRLNTVEIASHPESSHQIGLTDWVDWAQAFALAVASVGLALLILGLFPRINPLNLLPVKITIQVGK